MNIGTQGSLPLFAAISDIVFDCDLDRNVTPELAWACFHDGFSFDTIASLAVGNCSLVVAILWVIVPGILAGHCLCGPCLVGLHTMVGWRSNVPYRLRPWGNLSLGLLPWGLAARTHSDTLPSGLAPRFKLRWSCFFFAIMTLATARAEDR
jgi:hypothetical protein